MLKKLFLTGAAAMMIIILSCGVALAQGWTQEGEYWSYYDENNRKVTNTWEKGSDGQWRYLDSYGRMAVNSWVEDTFYVDANGIMLAGKWAQLQDNGKSFWYYFNEDGKKSIDCWKNLNSVYYHFDDNGHMETGWILDDMYYCDKNDGHMVTGWKQLEDPADQYYDSGAVSGTHWYYFQSSGKKFVPGETAGDYAEKKIDGIRYCFDQYGAMQTGWVKVNENASGIKAYKYFNTDGSARTGWYSLNPPEDLASEYEFAVNWFFFSNTGEPEAGSGSKLYESDIRKINGKRFLFDSYGVPVYGLKKVYTTNGDWETYYFGTVAQSTVQKGKMTVKEGDGTSSTFYFSSSGAGLTGIKGNNLYYKGKMQKADDKYETIAVNGQKYFINTSGTVLKNKTIKWDGSTYVTDADGCLKSINGKAYTGSGKAPYAPEFD